MPPELLAAIDLALRPWDQMILCFEQELLGEDERRRHLVNNTLTRATTTIHRWREGKPGIGGPFSALYGNSDSKTGKSSWIKSPDATEAERSRGALLRLEACSGLNRIADRHSAPGSEVDDVRKLLNCLQSHPLSVSPSLVPGIAQTPTDILTALETRVCTQLRSLDLEYGTQLSRKFPKAPLSKMATPEQVRDFGAAWTLATSAVTAEWLIRNARSLKQAIKNLPEQDLNGARDYGSNALRTTISTDRKDRPLRLTLQATPVVCNILNEDERHWIASMNGYTFSQIDLHMKRLDDAGDRQDRPRHFGRNVRLLYLAVMIETLAQSTASEQIYPMSPPSDNSPASDAYVLPNPLRSHLPGGHWHTVSALVQWHLARGGDTPPQRATRLAGDLQQTRSAADAAVYPLKRDKLRITEAPTERNDCIAQMHLPWTLVRGRVPTEWIDVAVVVRYQGRWHVLITSLEDADEDDEDLVLLSVDPLAPEKIPNELLRKGIYDSHWMYRNAGLGVFLSALIDLGELQD